MLLAPAACVGTLGANTDEASFDVTYAPTPVRPAGPRAATVGRAVLEATRAPSFSGTDAVRRPSLLSGSVAVGSALAKASVNMEEAVSAPTGSALSSESTGDGEPESVSSAAPSSPALDLNLPLDLESALRNITGGAELGEASWFDAPDGTCAHQTLPFGTLLKVTSLHDGMSTTCEVDDRGPYIDGRVIDLSYDVFEQLAHPGSGVIHVVIEVIGG
jgi:hypothetical protein